ncbi:CHAP domain-containing protein [Streptacidiphilus rugosus]|uniref:CHAP domain-containing protein n=1 Tax=Streptacidiphilus rugosus TaxID=405783 RepID=UPI00056C1C4B|nr:CHAP domain-containing protein [Streptacidiphilus rugosus]
MPRASRSLSAIVLAAALAAPMGAMSAAHAADPTGAAAAATAEAATSRHAMTVDGVALTVTNPDMPVGASFAAKPGDSVQSASVEAPAPFRFFSVTAVPFGEQLPKSDFPVAASGGAAAWRSVGGPSTRGPVATLFGQKVVGQVRHETDGTSKLLTVQWIVEAGKRVWVVRAEHAEPNVPARFGAGITVTSGHLTTPTTVDVTAANTGSHPHGHPMATTTTGDPAISFGGALPAPPSSYWNHGNGTCDGGFDSLLNQKIAGLQVCGYSNGNDRATGWGSNEWECAELPMRYAIQRWGLTGNDGGNGKDQADNLTTALNKIHPGRFVLRGNSLSDHTAPQPGDVIAYYDSGAGHTGVVIASHVDANGNGTIDMVHQNWNAVASTPGEWDGITVSNGMVENVLGGSGDVHWMHDTSWTPIPAGFNVNLWGFNSGQTLSGTVNLTAHPTQEGVINSLTYQITGPNGYNSGPLSPSAGGASYYPLAFDTIPLAPGTYTVSMTANEIDGQNHTYVGGSFTLQEPQGTNVLRAANGTIAVYNVGTDGNVYGTNQNTVGGPFNSWAQLSSGIQFTGKVAAIQDSSGAISLYARSADGFVWGTTQFSAGGAFGNWNIVGGNGGVASDPAVLLTRNGTVAIYVTNGVGDVSGTSQATVGGTFSNWASLGAPAGMTGRPSVIQDSTGRITVYARNTNGWLYGTTQLSAGGAFGNWNGVGGSSGVVSDPAVLLTRNGTVAIYVTNGVGDVSGTSQATVGGTFSNWASLGAPAGMTGRPSVIQDAAGRITVYAHNTNGWLYGTTQFSAGGTFGNWNGVGNSNPVAAGTVGDPTALFAADETVAVYSKDGVGDVLGVSQFSVGGAFGNWQMM